MRAVICRAWGDVEGLRVEDVPPPKPAADEILEDRGVLVLPDVLARIDFSRPVGVLCACALHFVPDEEKPHEVIAGYRDHLAPGSYLAISHGATATTEEDPDDVVGAGIIHVPEGRRLFAAMNVATLPEVGCAWIGSSGSVTPGTPMAVLKTTGDPVRAWKVGMVVTLAIGLTKTVLAFAGDWARRTVPRACICPRPSPTD